MDVEDEDEEGAESQNATADQDVLETTVASQGQEEEEGIKNKDETEERREDQNTKTLESEEALECS